MEESGMFRDYSHLTVEKLLAPQQLGRTLDVRPVKACRARRCPSVARDRGSPFATLFREGKA